MTEKSSGIISFLQSEYPNGAIDKALFRIIPVPYEATVSYGAGTNHGPQAILEASVQLECFDGIDCPGDRGMHTRAALDCRTPREMLFEEIAASMHQATGVNANGEHGIPVMLGGEHSITYPAVRGVQQAYSDLGVVQFDAHADLRESYEGTPYSHACVMRRVHEDLKIPIYQLGVRSLSADEFEYRRKHAISGIDAQVLCRTPVQSVELPDDFPSHVYLTVDIDVLDSALMPATGTPVPGGLGWYQLLALVQNICVQRTVVAIDLVELAPRPGRYDCDYTAAELIYRIMGIVARSRASGK